MNFLFAIGASVVVSLISLIGILSLLLKDGLLNKVLLLLVGFGAGGLIGGAFLHLLPEALEASNNFVITFVYVIIGFIIFFILERYLHWRHCHDEKCNVHAFTYLSLIGDGVHNFLDGLIIGASFFAGIKIGIVATVAIILHEIPQELGDFGILVYGGFSKFKALMYNFISAATAIVGTLIGYAFASRVSNFANLIIPIAAGGFIYIASCDLIPELHKQSDIKKATLSMLFFLFGILLMLFLKLRLH
jgi:zinc and cadmium transporter